MSRPHLIVFLGDLGASPVERMVGESRRAATLDALEAALATTAYAGATLLVDEPLPSCGPLPGGVTVVLDERPFAFETRLREIVRASGADAFVYFGGGSLPLLTPEGFREVADALEREGIVTNNAFSADLVGLRPASALDAVRRPFDSDNPLPRLIREATGLPTHALDRTAATQFDIDSPADLRVLAAIRQGGARLRECVASFDLDTLPLHEAMRMFTDTQREVLVAGRVGSHVWRMIERDTACRVRVLAEERGMQADGRLHTGKVRSILGQHLQAVGEARFFADIAELGDIAFLDYRVVMAHLGESPSRADRFAADLGRTDEIENAALRRFTAAATRARIPVILGGHSLVSGGLLALIDAAWEGHDSDNR